MPPCVVVASTTSTFQCVYKHRRAVRPRIPSRAANHAGSAATAVALERLGERCKPPKDTKYIVKRISSCPDVGYFFRRERGSNELDPRCLLCFCQDDGTAVCWRRENKRCDAQHYKHGLGKRDTRVRRSPISLTDIFFRDATRDVFNKQLPQVCKPYETSFSEGCPPADWCTGCTVCDCDAHGRWDCHVLSFCPDKKDKSKTNKNTKPIKGSPKRTTSSPKKPTPTQAKKSTQTKQPTAKTPAKNKNTGIYNTRKPTQPTTRTKVKQLGHISPKPLIIGKDTVSKQPIMIRTNHSKLMLNKNETVKITQEVYKKVVSAVQKMISKKFATSMPSLKTIQKRSLEKKTQPCIKNSKNAKKNVEGNFKSAGPNKKQYNKVVSKKATTIKKNYAPGSKKLETSKYNKQNNKVKRNSQKPLKGKKVTPQKKPKPTKRVWRAKREISLNDNLTDSTLLINPVTPHKNDTSELTSTEKNIISKATEKNIYYQYSMITPKPFENLTNTYEFKIKYVNATNEVNNSNLINENYITIKPKNESEIITIEHLKVLENNDTYVNTTEKVMLINDIAPDYNDLKFNKRTLIKHLKNTSFFTKLNNIVNITINSINQTNTSNYDGENHKTNSFEVIRLVTPKPTRYYNRSKIVNTIRQKTRNGQKGKPDRSFKERIINKIDDLQNVLKRLLKELRKNNTTKFKPKRFSVIKYLRKLFRKVFKKRGEKVINVNNKAVFNNHVINSICDNFEECDRSQSKNPILQEKIKDLYSESFTILKTINIIKGLLRFLEHTNEMEENLRTNNVQSKFNNDILRLSAILKDHYSISGHNLTNTEMIQIDYIKQNTKVFIASVGKFATILNEIINFLTKPDEIRKHHVVRDLKKKIKLENGSDYYLHLKDLMEKYSLIQGELIQRMLQSVDNYQQIKSPEFKQYYVKQQRNQTLAILKYSDNIIKNLKKLKEIAASLASVRQHRRKRDLMREDDAMEYLLTLMEYLLKQNRPLDTAPVNDGIDLLIEAIKSAPDIKPIKKKVLQTIPVDITTAKEKVDKNVSVIDISIDTSNLIKEYNDTNETGPETAEQVSVQERDEDQPPRDRLIMDDTKTEPVYYKKLKVWEVPNDDTFETTIVPRAHEKLPAEDTTEHNNFEKLENAVNDEDKKIEVFIGDVDEEDSNTDVTVTTHAPEVEMESVTVVVPITTTDFKLPEIRTRQNNVNNLDVSASGSSDGEKRVAFDWLTDGEEEIAKEVKPLQNKTTPQTTKKEVTKAVTIAAKQTHIDNISSMTKEIIDEEAKRKKSRIDDIMRKKQMDLLNSLDYGTDRADVEEAESKDGDERYSGDIFQSYF